MSRLQGNHESPAVDDILESIISHCQGLEGRTTELLWSSLIRLAVWDDWMILLPSHCLWIICIGTRVANVVMVLLSPIW